MTPRLLAERGSAMVTAMLVTMVMLSVSLSAIGFVDTQTRESGRERKREAIFQLSEGVLNSQIFLLSRSWPGTDVTAFPTSCTQANATVAECPDTANLVSSFTGPDYKAGISWKTQVFDNQAPYAENYFDEAKVTADANWPRWDKNQDTYMWVRAEATLPNGRSRALVALVKAELLTTPFPNHAVVAGRIDVTQSGNQRYINTDAAATGSGQVVVRCADVNDDNCVNYDPEKPHIKPSEPKSIPGTPSALTPETIERLRDHARANGTYYKPGTCPSDLSGPVLFIENATGCTAHNANKATYNTSADPGVMVIGSGSFEMQNPSYYGLLYHVNASDGYPGNTALGLNSAPAVRIKSGSIVYGAVIIDGNGTLEVGNNGGGSTFPGNIIYDGNASSQLRAFGTAGIVQNSFREIRTTGGSYTK